MALHAQGEIAYSEKDVMLYALGVGMGGDPLDPRELAFVYERGLKVLPSFAAMLMLLGPTLDIGLNWLMLVHGEQRLEIHRSLPPAALLSAESRVVGMSDKGKEKGALIFVETVLAEARQPLATLMATIFARGDGGDGDAGRPPPALRAPPARPPDAEIEIPTRPDQALLYRLTGDRNPVHADPAFASAAGFPRPVLHGLCTYAIACRAVMQTYCDFDPTRIRSFDARFSAPVFPGETIAVRMWRDEAEISFEAAVHSRSSTVLENGKAVLAL
ncbi:MAG TPA: MaoC/PaaZ C-terminal domain-containing protein [Caulobacterales bacterium]|nr:MaoC/PaaZ C-terminal domain-containing protein [Caulobacterales bacterium]